jgi:N-hydroxyarylamine O-acetyltransferase
MVAEVDLDAYFGRIGYDGPRAPTLATLRAIHALHPAAIPFENLDPLLGRPVSLELAAVQHKLVGSRRGGYCFEHNTLFAAVLDALGFTVTRLGARVRWILRPDEPDGPRLHKLLRVDLPEGPYLADVGFGGHLMSAPIPLQCDVAQAIPGSVLRLTGKGEIYTLQVRVPDGWRDAYRFTLEPQLPADYAVGNWFTSTHPEILFRGNLLMERLTTQARSSLFNTRLMQSNDHGATTERILGSAGELGEVLEAVFDVAPPADAAEIWARLPRN